MLSISAIAEAIRNAPHPDTILSDAVDQGAAPSVAVLEGVLLDEHCLQHCGCCDRFLDIAEFPEHGPFCHDCADTDASTR